MIDRPNQQVDVLDSSSPDSPTLHRLVGGKLLRCGYTTGTCAAAAAKAATTMLITQTPLTEIRHSTPDGTTWLFELHKVVLEKDRVTCAVKKDAGDDPDATDGALIFATVTRQSSGITIDGGFGIGRVTKAGLDQPIGNAAINSVPRRMIDQAVREAAEETDEAGGWQVIISCPTGEQIARKTFNPRLGVIGGISILGTSGIVEPMSNAALVETMAREISILANQGVRNLLIVIGNYGESFVRDSFGLISDEKSAVETQLHGVVKSSNFVGDAISQAVENGFERVLVVGHIGKLVKAGIGMLNTHSSVGDGRMETLVSCALEAGAELAVLSEVLVCASTDAALVVLDQVGLKNPTMDVLARRIQRTLDRHVPETIQVEWVCFMREDGIFTEVARSDGASTLIERWRPN